MNTSILTKKHLHFKQIGMALCAMLFIAMNYQPVYPEEMLIQHSGTSIFVIFLLIDLKRNRLSCKAFTGVLLFTMLHIVAARWIYSNVPYDEWMKTLFGFSLNQKMGWTRNHFDRLVHFSYGLLITPFFYDFYRKRKNMNHGWASLLALEFIMASSLFYEFIEWALALVMAAESAENYLGQQGDVWDAHKDMFCATTGALLCLILLSLSVMLPKKR